MVNRALVLIIALGAFAAVDTRLSAIERTKRTASSAASATGQEARKTVWDGVYTEKQAERGQQTYKRACGYCHRDNLSGGGGDAGAPALVGSSFSFRWRGVTLAEMFDTIETTMPQDDAASLSPQTCIDIISFLLKANEMPAGDTELPPDTEKLEQILITEKPPKN